MKYNGVLQARVAQLARAFDSHSKGPWFKSTHEHNKNYVL